MSDRITEFGGEVKLCKECHAVLSPQQIEHGLEGFGHEGRCCDCYDEIMWGMKPRAGRNPR